VCVVEVMRREELYDVKNKIKKIIIIFEICRRERGCEATWLLNPYGLCRKKNPPTLLEERREAISEIEIFWLYT
jgi:hypothetical protein